MTYRLKIGDYELECNSMEHIGRMIQPLGDLNEAATEWDLERFKKFKELEKDEQELLLKMLSDKLTPDGDTEIPQPTNFKPPTITSTDSMVG